jgi:secondary thiamine-phosphate synthase enzyme
MVMKSHTEYLWMHTKKKRELVQITKDLKHILEKSKMQEGVMLVSALHITSAIWVNDDEPGLHEDFAAWLDNLAPQKKGYKHHRTGEDNADAHLKRTLVGHQVIIPITKGELDLGPWERVFYAEFDGQRDKRVVVKLLGE